MGRVRTRGGAPFLTAWLLLCLLRPVAAGAEAWRSTGPDGGWVTVLFRPYGPGPAVAAGTYGGGVFYSDDGGLQWRDVTGNARAWIVSALTGRAEGIPRFYLGTEEGVLYRSGGFTGSWDFASAGVGLDPFPPVVTGLALDPVDNRRLALSSTDGLFRTRTAGATWPDSLQRLERITLSDVVASDTTPVRLYAAGPQEIFRSDDDGFSWRTLTSGLPGRYKSDLEIWPGSRDTLLVATFYDGLYLSEDGENFRYAGPTASPADAPHLRAVEVDPSTGEILVGAETGLYRSGDFGRSWHRQPDGLGSNFPVISAVSPGVAEGEDLLLGSFAHGVLLARPGQPFQPRSRGLRATWITDLAVDGPTVVATTRNGRLYLSQDGGETWVDRTGALDSLGLTCVALDPQRGRWVVGSLEGLYWSEDAGLTWHRPEVGYPPAQAVWCLVEAPAPEGRRVYAGTARGVYVSGDFGPQWKRVESLPADTAYDAGGVSAEDGWIWMGARGVGAYRGRIDQDFAPFDLGLGASPGIRAFAFPSGRADVVLAATRTGLYRWREGEGTVPLHDALPEPAVEDLLVRPGGEVYAALASSGVHRSDDEGDSWQAFSEGLVPPRPTCLAWRGTGEETLLAGTFAKGVFLRALAPAAAPTTAPSAARPRVVLSSAPNPFNPRTELRLDLARAGWVRSAVYDRRGRRVALLHEGPLPAGTTRWIFEAVDRRGRPLASGVYLWKVQAEGVARSRSLTLVR